MGGADGYGSLFIFIAKRDPFTDATTVAVTPKLQDGERIVNVFPGTWFRISGEIAGPLASGAGGYPGPGEDSSTYFDPTARKGTLFVTDRRLLYLRRKFDWKGGYLAYRDHDRARNCPKDAPERALGCAGLEYFEIPLGDVKSVNRGVFRGSLLIMHQDRSYTLRLPGKQLRAIVGALGNNFVLTTERVAEDQSAR